MHELYILQAGVRDSPQPPHTAGREAGEEVAPWLSSEETQWGLLHSTGSAHLRMKDVVAINSLNLYCILLIGT